MHRTPQEIIDLHRQFERRVRGCTRLQIQELKAQFDRDLRSVRWEGTVEDVSIGEGKYRLELIMRVDLGDGRGPVEMDLVADIHAQQPPRERLLALQRGQRVAIVGVPHFDEYTRPNWTFHMLSATLV